jgi:hypothetical protein
LPKGLHRESGQRSIYDLEVDSQDLKIRYERLSRCTAGSRSASEPLKPCNTRSSNASLDVARIEIGSFPRSLQGAERMNHRVFSRTPRSTIPGNRAQEPLTEQDDDGYD